MPFNTFLSQFAAMYTEAAQVRVVTHFNRVLNGFIKQLVTMLESVLYIPYLLE